MDYRILTLALLVSTSAATFAYGPVYQSIGRPITSAKLFDECSAQNLKPGTQPSRFCELWDQHIAFLEARLDEKCKTAGERIIQTADNVKGVVIRSAGGREYTTANFHESEDYMSYVMPTAARNYRAVEIELGTNNYLHYGISNIRPAKRGPLFDQNRGTGVKPTFRYQVSYRQLGNLEENRMGLFGDLTTVTDLKTGEMLGEREFYYYVINAQVTNAEGQRLTLPGHNYNWSYVATCRNYAPRPSRRTNDRMPRSSYEFASRVLIPPLPTHAEALALYDLTRGMGRKRQDCVGIQMIGPGINATDLVVKRAFPPGTDESNGGDITGKADLVVQIRGTGDQLICSLYFLGAHFPASWLFYDGDYRDEDWILKLGGLSKTKS